MGCGIATVHLVVAAIRPGSEATGWLINAAFVLGAALCLARAASLRHERLAWSLVGAGLLFQAFGDRYYKLFLADAAHVSQPSIADVGYLAFYPLVGLAIVLMLRARLRSVNRSLLLDAAVAAPAVLALVAAFVLSDALAVSDGDLAATLTNLAYPIADLMLLGLLVGGTQLLTKRADRGLALVGAALILFVIADLIYLHRSANGTYAIGGWLDALWSFAAIAMGVAAWQQPRSHDDQGWNSPRRVLVTVGAAMLIAAGVQLWDHFQHVTVVAAYLATATILAALVRLVVSLNDERDTFDLLAQSEARYQVLALHDPLTGLANRSLFDDRLRQLCAQRPPLRAALVMVDLDRFKDVNDSLGHAAGDELLIEVAARLQHCVRPGDTVARLGGDEFCIAMTTDHPQAAANCGERIVAALQQPYRLTTGTAHVSASAGVALHADAEEAVELLQLHADSALYEAKTAGRAQCVVHDPTRTMVS